MSSHLPKMLFVGAGNIAQSIMKGIIKAQPKAASQIMATAPSNRNLKFISQTLGCKTIVLNDQSYSGLRDYNPDCVFLCMKPQVMLASMNRANASQNDILNNLLSNLKSTKTIYLSLLAGIKADKMASAFSLPRENIVRVMLNTAAEIGLTSVFYHSHESLPPDVLDSLESLLGNLGQPIVKLNDENLIDVATGLCGSGIAFFYEMIQTISDIGVKNGLPRAEATLVAAQLSKSAGEMLVSKQVHPYQLRDEVTSPAGTTIFGLESWHEQSTSQRIARAFQASIDRAKSLSEMTDVKASKTNKS